MKAARPITGISAAQRLEVRRAVREQIELRDDAERADVNFRDTIRLSFHLIRTNTERLGLLDHGVAALRAGAIPG